MRLVKPDIVPVAIRKGYTRATGFSGKGYYVPEMSEKRDKFLKREIGRTRQQSLGQFFLSAQFITTRLYFTQHRKNSNYF